MATRDPESGSREVFLYGEGGVVPLLENTINYGYVTIQTNARGKGKVEDTHTIG